MFRCLILCITTLEGNSAIPGSRSQNEVGAAPLSAEKVKAAAVAGLAGAATKAKLFADHEEREIQRLSANIINHQVYSFVNMSFLYFSFYLFSFSLLNEFKQCDMHIHEIHVFIRVYIMLMYT